jgi:multisubunit Na+/H+ antiporter MnhF subunit
MKFNGKLSKKNLILCIVLVAILLCIIYYTIFIMPNVEDRIDLNARNPYHAIYSSGKLIDGIITSREEGILLSNIIDVIKKQNLKEIEILDFGSGDGRFFPIIQKLSILYPKVKIKYLAYDVIEVGLKKFQVNLIEDGFKLIESKPFINTEKVNKFKPYRVSELKRDNLYVTILLSNAHSIDQEVTSVLGENIKIIFSMYGSFMHIPYYNKRVDMLKTLSRSLNEEGLIILDVPAFRNFKIILKKCDKLRAEKRYIELGDAIEEGDIIYRGIYYHLTTFNELKRLAEDSNLIIKEKGITGIRSPHRMQKNVSEFNRIYTSLMSSVLSLGIVPERQIESNTAYIYAVLELNKSRK